MMYDVTRESALVLAMAGASHRRERQRLTVSLACAKPLGGLAAPEVGDPLELKPPTRLALLPCVEMERIRFSKSSERCFTDPLAVHCFPFLPADLAACSVRFGNLSKCLSSSSSGQEIGDMLSTGEGTGRCRAQQLPHAAHTDAGQKPCRMSSRRCTRCTRCPPRSTLAPSPTSRPPPEGPPPT